MDWTFTDEPETEARSNGHGRAREHRDLSTIWADDITIDLSGGGLIDGLLPNTGLTVLYGESGAGKTFVTLDMACHIAAGRPWRGMGVEQGAVIYVAAEAPQSVKRRIWAWKRRYGVEHLPALVIQSSVNLLVGDADAVAELVAQVARDQGRVALVVVDTLARSMTGNENSPEDMGKYVDSCARIRGAAETHVLVVHHSGKDLARGARGHSSLRAASDTELEVTKTGNGGCLAITKNRDEEDVSRFGFRLEPVELGINGKGRLVSTCVAVEAELAGKEKKVPLTPKQRTVLECLATAIADHGQEAPLAHDIPRKARVVAMARWRDAAIRYLPSDQPEWRKRQDFARTAEALQAKYLVRHVDGWCWPTSAGAEQ